MSAQKTLTEVEVAAEQVGGEEAGGCGRLQSIRSGYHRDYDAQSAVERELVLRLASLLWRLRRATTMETGLFEIQADHLSGFRKARDVNPASREALYALFGRADTVSFDTNSHGITNGTEALPNPRPKSVDPAVDTTRNFARCFLRLANLPNFALDRLSRYEATPWRQAGAGQ
jgi:hypothetical protein